MDIPLFTFVLVFAAGSALSAALTPLAIRLGRHYNIVAVPGGRRQHEGRVVRIGGLPLYPAFVAASLLPVLLGVPRRDPLEITRLTGMLIGAGIVWIMGLIDDRYELPSWAQLCGILVSAGVAIAFKVFIELFNNPFTDNQVKVDWYLMVPITLTWITAMTGTMNVLDGLDGLATGVTAISATVLFLHMLRLEQYSVSLLPLGLLGCCLGFLPYNFAPARIFLGGGAYVLGYALASLSIIAGAKVASVLLLLWLPILDLLWQMYCRWRRGDAISYADRGHLHFRLLDLGWPMRKIVLLYYAITATLGAVALLSSNRALKFAVLSGGGLLMLAALASITRLQGQSDKSD